MMRLDRFATMLKKQGYATAMFGKRYIGINVYSKHPEIVTELKALLEEAKTSGRTAPKR